MMKKLNFCALLAMLSIAAGCGGDGKAASPDAATGVSPDAAAALDPVLTSLSISSTSPLVPAFAAGQLAYQVDFSALEGVVIVTPTALDPAASILVEGVAVTSGAASSPIELALGTNQLTVQVTSGGGATQSYTLDIDRGGELIEQIAYGKASNTQGNDRFGYSVALEGDTMVVGAKDEDSAAIGVGGDQLDLPTTVINSGAVYVFRRVGDTWAQEAYLKASNTGSSDSFGASVALSGDTLAVGAMNEGSDATVVDGNQASNVAPGSGAVYMFRRTGTTWAQEAYLKASNTGASDLFGRSVALSGETLVVAAIFEDSDATGVNGDLSNDLANDSGAAYVFRRTGTTWTQEAALKGSNASAGDNFGSSVAIFGDTVAVGAGGEASNATGIDGNQADNTAVSSGAVYLFERTATTWAQAAYLKASNTGVSDSFGNSVALSSDTLVVGAADEDSDATGVNGDGGNNNSLESGAVYVFRRTANSWTQEAYLKASNTGSGDSFSNCLALKGDTLAVGAINEASNASGVDGNQADDSTKSGAVYLFRRTANAWTQEAYLKASNPGLNDFFATFVALSADSLVVGASREGSNALGFGGDQANNEAGASGAVYLFQ